MKLPALLTTLLGLSLAAFAQEATPAAAPATPPVTVTEPAPPPVLPTIFLAGDSTYSAETSVTTSAPVVITGPAAVVKVARPLSPRTME